MNCMYNEDKSTVVWNLRMFSYQAQSKNQIKKTNKSIYCISYRDTH